MPAILRWMMQLLYWLLAAIVLFLVFSNKQNDLGIRLMVVAVLTTMSFLLTQLINRYFIPKFFFEGRLFLFFYQLLFTFVASIWFNSIFIMLILLYMANNTLDGGLPNKTDLILLLSGSYIIILFATIVHFVQESYRRTMERDRISNLKTETELKLKDARLQLLQGQLHPHFLFNMLNNLYGLWIEKSNTTPEVILKLSSLLDYMLYRCDKEKVPLNEEISFMKNYIDLELLRHDNRLQLETDMPTQDETLLIPPLILFSFVENAFKHGVNKTSGDSLISIHLKMHDKQLQFKIENTYDKTAQNDKNNGIGLKNVKERLQLIYPEKQNVIINQNNGIFKVELNIELKQ
ncbi:MAG: histidine kinase [Prolixibacteraceae bacterium]|nr:histidine kinase [Prolixibacteraceae bacterium]